MGREGAAIIRVGEAPLQPHLVSDHRVLGKWARPAKPRMILSRVNGPLTPSRITLHHDSRSPSSCCSLQYNWSTDCWSTVQSLLWTAQQCDAHPRHIDCPSNIIVSVTFWSAFFSPVNVNLTLCMSNLHLLGWQPLIKSTLFGAETLGMVIIA